MSSQLYKRIRDELKIHVDPAVSETTRERLALLVMGILESESSKPSQIARAIRRLGLSEAKAESLERRVRRIENDPAITASLCFHPFARAHLRIGKPEQLILAIDPTTQDERVVMVTIGVWYRGRALPLAWAVWPANQKLKGPGFWERVAALLAEVADLLPPGVPVIWLADRAFGTPQFTDLLVPYGWHFVVRVQGQTRCRDVQGRECTIRSLVHRKGQRAKLAGNAFKKRGWRAVSVVVYWGRRHTSPLCLVTDLPPDWSVIYHYRQRYSLEAMFRDYKSHGWHWEANQVRDIDHIQRLLVGMAFATWFALLTGIQVAAELLAQPITPRRSLPWAARRSLFTLGLHRLQDWLHGACSHPLGPWFLFHWQSRNWRDELYFRHSRAFVFHSQQNCA